jgi:hypothetical protein
MFLINEIYSYFCLPFFFSANVSANCNWWDDCLSSVSAPNAASHLSVPATDSDGNYNVTWRHSGNAQFFRVFESKNAASFKLLSLGYISSYKKTVAINDKSSGLYRYRIQSCNVSHTTGEEVCAMSSISNTLTVLESLGTPNAPSLPTKSSTGKYNVSWSKPSGSVTHYQLQERFNSATWINIGNNIKNTYFTIDNQAEGRFEYRVRACNLGSCSSYSVNSAILVENTDLIPNASLSADIIPTHENLGTINGKADVSGGAAAYSIPIIVPPGRHNMQPNVTLSYSSRAGNGVAGLGMTLSASGAIHRCSRIVDIDGVSKNVDYSPSDRLCMNGQRLMLVSGVYGKTGAEYRTEADTFSKITQVGNTNSVSSSFIANLKNGRQLFYGGTFNAKHKVHDSNLIVSWALNKQQDPSGNQIFYDYINHDFGEYNIDSINYTGFNNNHGNREVKFHYETRPDPQIRYKMGKETRSSYRLKTISTHYDNERIHAYHLKYILSDSSRRSIVSEIKQCGQLDTNCLPATAFSSHRPTTHWKKEQSINDNALLSGLEEINNGDSLHFKDLNGDGLDELLLVKRTDLGSNNFTYNVSVYKYNNDNTHYTLAKTFNDYEQGHLLYTANPSDINNNGIVDFLVVDNNKVKFVEFDQDYNPVTSAELLTLKFSLQSAKHLSAVDVDADGYQDILVSAPSKTLHYYKNKDGSGVNFSSAYDLFNLREQYPGLESASPMDVDGDGLLDFLLYRRGASVGEQLSVLFGRLSNNRLYVDLYTDSQLNLPSQHKYNQYIMADLNGDGLKDFVRTEHQSGQSFWSIQLNQGNRKFANMTALNMSHGIHRRKLFDAQAKSYVRTQAIFGGIKVADIDNDGADELIVATSSSDDVCVSLMGFAKQTGEDIFIESCNDDMHNDEHNNQESSNTKRGSLTEYDVRRFHWTVTDFKVIGDQVTPAKHFNNMFYAPISTSSYWGGSIVKGLQFVDYNNDGFLDATYQNISNYRSTVNRNFGGLNIIQARLDVDFRGDRPSEGIKIQLNGFSHEHALVDTVSSITNGMGAKTHYRYAPLSRKFTQNGVPFYSVPPGESAERYINDGGDNAHFYFTSSMYLVSKMSVDDGIGGFYDKQFHYSEAIYNRHGRGFQGFRRIGVDTEHGIRTVTDFHQLHPYTGNIQEIRHCLIDGGDKDCTQSPLEHTKIEYKLLSTNAAQDGVYWVYPNKTTHYKRELASRVKILNTVDEIIDVDNYGNVLHKSKTINAGFGTYETLTLNTYEIDNNPCQRQ